MAQRIHSCNLEAARPAGTGTVDGGAPDLEHQLLAEPGGLGPHTRALLLPRPQQGPWCRAQSSPTGRRPPRRREGPRERTSATWASSFIPSTRGPVAFAPLVVCTRQHPGRRKRKADSRRFLNTVCMVSSDTSLSPRGTSEQGLEARDAAKDTSRPSGEAAK